MNVEIPQDSPSSPGPGGDSKPKSESKEAGLGPETKHPPGAGAGEIKAPSNEEEKKGAKKRGKKGKNKASKEILAKGPVQDAVEIVARVFENVRAAEEEQTEMTGDGADGGSKAMPLKEGDENSPGDTEKKDSISSLLERDLHHLSRPERAILYEEGVKRKEAGQTESALKCFLGAITGLSEETSFQELPKCLHAIADVYFDKDEYEKAVYFIQAEKMYYETALIDIASIHKTTEDDDPDTEHNDSNQPDEVKENNPNGPTDPVANSDDPDDDLSPEAKKGREFENLARLCLKERQLQLALEYCGKATKVYQSTLGDDHPITVQALDLFTMIYADVGKKLYTDAMKKFEEEEEVIKAEMSGETTQDPELRRRVHVHNNNNSKDGVAVSGAVPGSEDGTLQGELEPTSGDDQDDWVMTILLMLIFFLVTVFIAIAISSVYCYNNNRTGYCAQTRGDFNYWYMYVRHLIHDFRKNFR